VVALLRLDEIGSDHHGARVHNAIVLALGERWVWLTFLAMGFFGIAVDSLVFVPALSIYQAYLGHLSKTMIFTIAEALQSRRTYGKLLAAYSSVTSAEHGNWTPTPELRASVDQRKVQVQELFMKSYTFHIAFNTVLCLIGAWPCMAAGIYETLFPALLTIGNLVNMVVLSKQLVAARRVHVLRKRSISRLRLKTQLKSKNPLSSQSTKWSSSAQILPSPSQNEKPSSSSNALTAGVQ
jgi:hypothetical protein